MINTSNTTAILLQYGETIKQNKIKYATQIGEISIAWNSLHHLFFSCFVGIMYIPIDVSKSMWESLGGDKSQRELLKSSLGIIVNPSHRAYVEGILNDADTIAAYRNSLIHAIVDVDFSTLSIKPIEWVNPDKHFNRVNLMIEKNLFELIKQDLEQLHSDLLKGLITILDGKDETLPDRPLLKVYAYQTPPK